MFERIYEAAIKQDQSALQQVLSIGCIDEHKKGRYCLSAITQLAYEKNTQAVEFLLNNGANINYAAMGAAMANNREYAEELMCRGASHHCVAWGAAFANNKDYVSELIDLRNADRHLTVHGAAVGGHMELTEDLIRQGAEITRAAAGAVIAGHLDYADNLIKRGADIQEIAFSAGMTDRKEYAEKFIQRDAMISFVAEGAAMGANQDYAKELIQRGANEDWVIGGASKGGHREYLEGLIRPYTDLTEVAYGASLFGHRSLAESLMKRGARSDAVARGAYVGFHIDNEKTLIAYLSFYQPENILSLINNCRKNGMGITEATLNRIIAISKHMHINKLSYKEALVRTDSSCQGMLYLLMMLTVTDNTLVVGNTTLPWEIWKLIFSFVTPVTLDNKTIETLVFITERAYLCAQLSSYQQSWFVKHRDRASSFFHAISQTNNRHEITELISNQVKVLQGDNPYQEHEQNTEYKHNIKNTTVDKYHRIIGFWNNPNKGTITESNNEVSQVSMCSIS